MVLSLNVVRSYAFSTFEDLSVFFFEILNCLKDESKQTKYGHSWITAVFPRLILFLVNKFNKSYSEVIFLQNEMFWKQ